MGTVPVHWVHNKYHVEETLQREPLRLLSDRFLYLPPSCGYTMEASRHQRGASTNRAFCPLHTVWSHCPAVITSAAAQFFAVLLGGVATSIRRQATASASVGPLYCGTSVPCLRSLKHCEAHFCPFWTKLLCRTFHVVLPRTCALVTILMALSLQERGSCQATSAIPFPGQRRAKTACAVPCCRCDGDDCLLRQRSRDRIRTQRNVAAPVTYLTRKQWT